MIEDSRILNVCEMFVVLIDVLHAVGPALNVCGLLLAVTTELSTGEDDQGGEEPAVS